MSEITEITEKIKLKEDLELDKNKNLAQEKIDIEDSDIDQLIKIIKNYSDSEKPITISKKAEIVKSLFYKKINKLNKDLDIKKIDPRELIFKEYFDIFRNKKNLSRKEIDKKEIKNLKIKKEIISEIKALTSEVELEKNTFNKFRELQKKWNTTGHVGIREKNEVFHMYNHYTEVFYDYLKLNRDLRDIDFKKNLEQKTKICTDTEKLISLKSINEMHSKLQDFHEDWKNIGPTKKENRELIWERFQEISRKINKKRNDHFLELKEKDSKKIASKTQICLELNQLSEKEFKSHQECLKAVEECNILSEKWKSLGRVNKKDNKKTWQQFQISVNNFYKNKNNFYKLRKENTKNIIQSKNRLCDEADKISNNQDWNTTTKKLIRLQEDWKKTGFIKGNANDELWNKFKNSCDKFFNAKKEFFKKSDIEIEKNLKEKTNILRSVSEFKKTNKPLEDIQFIKNKCEEWIKLNNTSNTFKINKDFKLECKKTISSLDLEKNIFKVEQFLINAILIKNNPDQLEREKTIINEKIEVKIKEMNLFENNKSFFVGKKDNNPLLDQIENNIKNLAEEIKLLKNNLKILNTI
ncbi:MAG: DUF349 domain-containing protein [Flavobacteriales bacterium]